MSATERLATPLYTEKSIFYTTKPKSDKNQSIFEKNKPKNDKNES